MLWFCLYLIVLPLETASSTRKYDELSVSDHVLDTNARAEHNYTNASDLRLNLENLPKCLRGLEAELSNPTSVQSCDNMGYTDVLSSEEMQVSQLSLFTSSAAIVVPLHDSSHALHIRISFFQPVSKTVYLVDSLHCNSPGLRHLHACLKNCATCCGLQVRLHTTGHQGN